MTITRDRLIKVAMSAALSLTTAAALPLVASANTNTSTQATTCTPGYTPCIANGSSDVDCYGGGGNGPRYTRRGVVYHVRSGYDKYRLDSDHNGLACGH